MSALRLLVRLIGITLLASNLACGADEGHAPTAPGSPAANYQVPVTGTVRDNTGQPIAAVTVVGSVQGMPRMNPATETDASGRFALTLTVPVTPAPVSLQTTSPNYHPSRLTTLHVPGTELAADIRLQRLLSVSVDRPLASVLLPGDPAWTFGTNRRCDPCQMVAVDTNGTGPTSCRFRGPARRDQNCG